MEKILKNVISHLKFFVANGICFISLYLLMFKTLNSIKIQKSKINSHFLSGLLKKKTKIKIFN